MGTLGRRYKLWWSGNDAGFGGVGILVKEEISGNVVEVGRKSDRVMAIVLTLGREVMCVWATKWKTRCRESLFFMMKWEVSGNREVLVK